MTNHGLNAFLGRQNAAVNKQRHSSVSQNYILRHGNRFVRSRLMPKSSAFRHSRIYRRKIRGACPRIFRIFIEIGLCPKSLIDFCNSNKDRSSKRSLFNTSLYYASFIFRSVSEMNGATLSLSIFNTYATSSWNIFSASESTRLSAECSLLFCFSREACFS